MKRRDLIKAGIATVPLLGINPLQLLSMYNDIRLLKSDFGPNFKWGVATAAQQIEGAWNIDGKGPSIWDTFSHKKGKIHNNENGDVSCDFYHHYASDLELLKQLNFQVFRFSPSWSRIFPEGIGTVNQKGVDYYHRVIDKCLELGIEPWPTCFHWDLPQALEDKGGWTNRDIIGWFSDYVDFITREYGDKVKNWMVLNEPMAFVALGYLIGMHAPGKRGFKNFYAATHHATMVQAEGGRIIRANVPGANIGTTFSGSHVEPKAQTPRHIKAAKKLDGLLNRLFIEPSLGMGYPYDAWKKFEGIQKYIKPGDEEKLKFEFDFIGVQNYTRVVAKFSLWPPFVWANQVKPKKLTDEDNLTLMNWEVYPEGIYKLLKQFNAYEGINKIIVTENGAAFHDEVVDGRVHDAKRLQFYKDYLANVLKAKNEGVNIQGYFAWTFLDNFEWAEGYEPRFGLVHVDFETQKRIVKDSGLWFQSFLK